MSSEASNPTKINLCSAMAENLIPSEIIKLGNEISNKIKQGEKIHNLTIGDFDPKIFPIPNSLKNNIITAYNDGQTNYPAANGMLELRTVISKYIKVFVFLFFFCFLQSLDGKFPVMHFFQIQYQLDFVESIMQSLLLP